MTALTLVCAVLASILVVGWIQHRGASFLGIWAAVFALCAAAAALAAVREHIPEFFAIDAANALRLFAYGLGWHAACRFSGRGGNWTVAIAPALLWLAGGAMSVFGEDEALRVLLTTGIVAAFGFAIAGELWVGSRDGQRLVRAAAIAVALHAAFFLVRFLAVLPRSDWAITEMFDPLVMGESLVFAVVLAFLLLSAAMEQVSAGYRRAALVDPLTGISNRRGFEGEVGRMLGRARRDGSFTTMLLLDIDHFKAVNDSRGHVAGDRALQAFSAVISEELRAGDLLARLGGEEFAVALAGCGPEQALRSAERMRKAVAELPFIDGDAEIRLTVSIGVVSQRGVGSLEALMEAADIALYRAKAGGRDRVEMAPERLTLAEAPAPDEPAVARRVA